jgi:hypothetical protein
MVDEDRVLAREPGRSGTVGRRIVGDPRLWGFASWRLAGIMPLGGPISRARAARLGTGTITYFKLTQAGASLVPDGDC